MSTQIKSMSGPKNYDNTFTKGKRPKRGPHCHSVLKRRNYLYTLIFWILGQAATVFALVVLGNMIYKLDFSTHFSTFAIAAISATILYIAYIIARRTCRCPLCKGTQLRPGRSQKHKKAFRIRPFSHAYTSMITMYSSATIRCLHCGTPFDITKKISKGK